MATIGTTILRSARIGPGLAVATPAMTALLVLLNGAGIMRDTAALTAMASAALLLFGLPHGSFDLALLRRAGAGGQRQAVTGVGAGTSTVLLVALYLGCAAAMYVAWQFGPVLALALFLAMAAVHFAEDWEACGSRFIAFGVAAALLSAPALLQIASLRRLFRTVTGDGEAAVLADALLLLAPMSMAIALVGVASLWHAAERRLACTAACALVAMVVLPPVQGFAVFFCLVHSPMQFRSHADMLGWRGFRAWRGAVVPISLAGLAVAAAVFFASWPASLADGVFISSFVTLSILTVPHMLVPLIAARLQRR